MLTESIQQNIRSSQLTTEHYPANECGYAKLDLCNNKPTYKKPSSGYFKLDLKTAWVDYIKRFEPYEWFVTLTFKLPTHPERADKSFKRWIRHVNEALYGRRYREDKKGVTCVKAIEYQKREVLHFHCLVGSPDLYKLNRFEWMRAWQSNCGMKFNTNFRAEPNKFDNVLVYNPNELDYLVNGVARIFKYDATRGAVNYCSKYVSKGGEINIHPAPELLHMLTDPHPKLNLQITS